MLDWLPGIITVMLSGIVTLIVLKVNTKTAKETTVATISVSAKEADTHEFTAIITAYKGTLEEVRGELTHARGELVKLNERVDTLEEDNFALSHHLDVLEAGYPNPPGPPPRPVLGRR